MRSRVKIGTKIRIMEFLSQNVALCRIQEKVGTDTLFILGEGMSMTIKENEVIEHDPFLSIPDNNEFVDRLNGDVVEMYFMFSCKGLNAAGKDLAGYIENCANLKYKNVVLIGHSKASVCFANAARWFKGKIGIIFISSPFKGTSIANKEEMKKRMSEFEYRIYSKYFKDHQVDRDIIPNSEFLCNADFSGVKKHICLNIVSILETVNSLEDVGCNYLSKVLNLGKSDGIVTKTSQEALNCSRTIYINASHANSMKRTLSMNLDKYVL